MQRRALMSLYGAEIDLLHLMTAGTEHVEDVYRAASATPIMGDQFSLCRDRPLIHRGIPACHRFLSEGPVRRLVVHLAFANFALGVFVAAAFPWPDSRNGHR